MPAKRIRPSRSLDPLQKRRPVGPVRRWHGGPSALDSMPKADVTAAGWHRSATPGPRRAPRPSLRSRQSPTARIRPSFRRRTSQRRSAPAAGLRMKSMAQLVVTASAATGPQPRQDGEVDAHVGQREHRRAGHGAPGGAGDGRRPSAGRSGPSSVTRSSAKSAPTCGKSRPQERLQRGAVHRQSAVVFPSSIGAWYSPREGGTPCPTRLRLRRDGAVATLTLDDPGTLNALSDAMLAALSDALADIAAVGRARRGPGRGGARLLRRPRPARDPGDAAGAPTGAARPSPASSTAAPPSWARSARCRSR